MLPFQINHQLQANVKVFAHLKINRVKVIDKNLAILELKKADRSCLEFSLIGSDNIMQLLRDFRKGDIINLVAEDGVARRISKGIDTEV